MIVRLYLFRSTSPHKRKKKEKRDKLKKKKKGREEGKRSEDIKKKGER